jgi:hypothetical protein
MTMPPNLPSASQQPFTPLPGRVGNLSIPQQHALDVFRKELQEEGSWLVMYT